MNLKKKITSMAAVVSMSAIVLSMMASPVSAAQLDNKFHNNAGTTTTTTNNSASTTTTITHNSTSVSPSAPSGSNIATTTSITTTGNATTGNAATDAKNIASTYGRNVASYSYITDSRGNTTITINTKDGGAYVYDGKGNITESRTPTTVYVTNSYGQSVPVTGTITATYDGNTTTTKTTYDSVTNGTVQVGNKVSVTNTGGSGHSSVVISMAQNMDSSGNKNVGVATASVGSVSNYNGQQTAAIYQQASAAASQAKKEQARIEGEKKAAAQKAAAMAKVPDKYKK